MPFQGCPLGLLARTYPPPARDPPAAPPPPLARPSPRPPALPKNQQKVFLRFYGPSPPPPRRLPGLPPSPPNVFAMKRKCFLCSSFGRVSPRPLPPPLLPAACQAHLELCSRRLPALPAFRTLWALPSQAFWDLPPPARAPPAQAPAPPPSLFLQEDALARPCLGPPPLFPPPARHPWGVGVWILGGSPLGLPPSSLAGVGWQRRTPLNPATPPWSRPEPVHPRALALQRAPTPGPVHHRTSVSPRAPPGPHPETAPKFTRAPTANPHGTEGFLRHFWGSPRTPQMCIMSTGRFEN